MVTTTAVFNDLHGPWIDPKAVDIVMGILIDEKPDRIVINGDLLDFYNVHNHGPKSPTVGKTLEDEISWGYDFFTHLRKLFPKTHIVFIYGNHEDRLERFIVKEAKSLFNYVKLDKLLDLKTRDIEWYPYNYMYQLEKSNLYIQHSPPSYSKNGAMVSLEHNLDIDTIYGCTHREQKAVRTGKSGKQYYSFFNGWLGSTQLSKSHKEVFKYTKGHENWQQCFSLVTTDNKKVSYTNQVSIKNHKAVHNGIIYEA